MGWWPPRRDDEGPDEKWTSVHAPTWKDITQELDQIPNTDRVGQLAWFCRAVFYSLSYGMKKDVWEYLRSLNTKE